MRLNPAVSSLALLTALFATALPATAQETLLAPLRISAAGLTPFEENEIGRSYTVIDGDQIQLSGTPYVADILRQVPGFAVSRTGGYAGLTQARVRGLEGNHVLVLIDGVPVGETSDGEFDFARLSVSNVERIEILRGPQSAFWGSSAMAGVVNIVTKSGGDDGLSGSLAGEFGSDGTKMTSASLSYGQDNFTASGSIGVRHTDGFNIASTGTELDGASHIDANARFRAEITPQLTVDGTIRYGKMSGDTDGTDATGVVVDTTTDTSKVDELFAALGAGWISDDGVWFQNARLSGGTTERKITSAWPDYITHGERVKASYQVGRNFDTPGFLESQHTVTLGYDFVHETFHQLDTVAGRQKRSAHSVVGEYRGTYYDQLFLTAALRHDFNNSFADYTTYSMSGAWQIPDTGTRLHASAGTGATNPSFFELFGTSNTFVSNPNLLPETSFGWDVGIEQTLLDGIVVLDATYFNQTLENVIIGSAKSVVNVPGLSVRQGVELSASLHITNGLTAGVAYTYLDARTPSGIQATRRPQHSGSVNLAYKLEDIPLTLHADVVLTGENLDSYGGTTHTLPAYTLVNAGLNYQINDQVEVYGRVHNLFDTKYQEVYGYATQGRTFYAGARAKF